LIMQLQKRQITDGYLPFLFNHILFVWIIIVDVIPNYFISVRQY